MKPLLALLCLTAAAQAKPPNVVVIVADDLGYGDLGCTGAAKIRTPNLDKLASQGVRFTNFHVAQAVCSASRAAILTGCYPNRVGVSGAFGPRAKAGLSPDEMTLAEVLKAQGYATAAVGKWHLGDRAECLPTNQGFDRYFGLPYSHDMWPGHPTNGKAYPPIRLIDGSKSLEPPLTDLTQSTLMAEYTRRAVDFIDTSAGKPFFLYFAHNAPHVPLFPAAATKGQSPGGTYGDIVEEIDRSAGEVFAALDRAGVADNTLVMFLSDNGPWLSYGDHAGSSGGLREGKATAFEGGVRVPCIARLPGVLPAGKVQDQPWMAIDLLPTIAKLAGAALPARKIDGLDLLPVWKCEPDAVSPQKGYAVYYASNELRAVIRGRWKLVFAHSSQTLAGPPGAGGKPGRYKQQRVPEALYDLVADVAESRDVASANPKVVAELRDYAEGVRADLGDRLTGRKASGAR